MPLVPNWIHGEERPATSRLCLDKYDPATGELQCRLARSAGPDVDAAIAAALTTQAAWAALTPVHRGELVRAAAQRLVEEKAVLAATVSAETGKSMKDALGETAAAAEMGFFLAGEGRRLYGRTTTSAVPNRLAMTSRQPIGVAGLVVAANTPIANVAWKAFPALMCGNTAVLKASEDAPATALAFAKLLARVGIAPGVFNVVQGLGPEAGAPLVEDSRVPLISFTGSSEVGRYINCTAGARLAKVCLELGGKNPFIVCDDAELERAAELAVLSAFSNAGQRCAAGSRIIVFASVYDDFRERLCSRVQRLRLGSRDQDDLGPVINRAQLDGLLDAIRGAVGRGARLLVGGERSTDSSHRGYYLQPTLLENVAADDPLSRTELFGPIACLYSVRDFAEALQLANDSPFGLTAAIHTRSVHRALAFTQGIRAGVTNVNGATYGSEPHMPFGGLRDSGNGFREAGTEVLDVYSEWKTTYMEYDVHQL